MNANAPLSPAPNRSAVLHAVAGAIIGVLVGSALWMLAPLVAFPLRQAWPYVLAPLFGAVVGLFALLMSGGRSRGALITTGVTALVAMYFVHLLGWEPSTPLRFLADIFTRPRVVLPYIVRILPIAALAAAGGLAVAFWDPLASLRTANPPRVRTPRVRAEAPVRPQPAVAPVPVVAEVAPTPAAAAYAAVAAPAPTAARAREPFDAGAFFKRNKVWLIGAAAGLTVVVIGVGAFALGRAFTPREQVPTQAERTPGEPAEPVVPVEPESDEGPAPGALPEDVVVYMYDAAAAGDEGAVYAAFTFGFALDPGTLEAWGDPPYEIELVTAGQEMGDILVQVAEPGGGFSDGDVVTWMLREERGNWRIFGWMMGTAQDYIGLDNNVGVNSGEEEDVTRVLLAFLSARMGGDIDRMHGYVTGSFRQQRPDFFSVEPQLLEVNVVDVAPEGDDYIVFVEETWPWGLEVHVYVLTADRSAWLVNELR